MGCGLYVVLEYCDKIWLSGTVIEAGRAAKCYISGQDYGDSPANFKEIELLNKYHELKQPCNKISTWTPTVIPKANWDAIGGFDEIYFPGFGSDPNLAMKMYKYGWWHFIEVGTCLVYHFSKGTTSRFKESIDSQTKKYFKQKWGIC